MEKSCNVCGAQMRRRRVPCPDTSYEERGLSCGVSHFKLYCPDCEKRVSEEPMRYHYVMTTQHSGRTGLVVATGSGKVEVAPGESERDVYGRILDFEVDRLGADSAVTAVLFYRLVPDEMPRDKR